MRASLLELKSLSVNAMLSRLKIMNNYLISFLLLDNKSFLQGEMIKIVLSMFPAVWDSIMTTAGLESREKFYKDLIEHLEKLDISLPVEPILKKDKSKDASPETSILKKEKKDTN